ncbi:hypothetical protein AMATHDRAFT_191686 [Amanita thiersii Skay4041]|uniref:DUF833-domain-containing protein n=1 Tax=Amanita thiersii Skay4041 TaxID=703135 RepID=A0A2A9NKX3_9AGAR|nr:hypothetical protein AMATHDRAFT_191686 [Amanita thiersii Skay4041]
MCIGVWTLVHPDYALILCTNRDEFLQRPTQNAHFHCFGEDLHGHKADILSGLDERAGGTWLGLNRAGRVALLTNITEPPTTFGTSRGSLVSSFLLSDSSHPLQDELGKIVPRDAKYSGFNLMLFAPVVNPDSTLSYESIFVTNHGGGGILTSRPLSVGERRCGGVSNGIDGAGSADWPKVRRATHDFDVALQILVPGASESDLVDRLMEVLTWQCPEPVTQRSELCNTVHVVPVPIKLANEPGALYGTRLSTVLLIRRDGQVRFVERDIWQLVDGKIARASPSSERTYQFNLGIQS